MPLDTMEFDKSCVLRISAARSRGVDSARSGAPCSRLFSAQLESDPVEKENQETDEMKKERERICEWEEDENR